MDFAWSVRACCRLLSALICAVAVLSSLCWCQIAVNGNQPTSITIAVTTARGTIQWLRSRVTKLFEADTCRPRQRRCTKKTGLIPELFLKSQQLIVLRHSVRTRRRTTFYLSGVGRDGEVSDRGVFGFAGAVRNHDAITIFDG